MGHRKLSWGERGRLVPHAEFYLSERVEDYCDTLRKALGKRGLPRKLYVDNGPGFRRHHHLTEIVPKETVPPQSPDHYRDGQLFGKGGDDDQL